MAHDPVPEDERGLVERVCRDGDMAAFEVLYRRYVKSVHALASRRSGSRTIADDVTSATFEWALSKLASFKWRERGLGPWLYRIGASELAEYYRAAGRASPHGERAQRVALANTVEPGVEEDVLGRLDAQVLRACIGRLRPRYQEVVSLRYLAGLSAAEAAEAMGIGRGSLAVTLHRAISALRRELEACASDERGDLR
ncbi:MAG: RNA polymerase sigma factor [Actinomycetota bacterium]